MDLIQANKDPKIQIKEIDRECYHVEFLRIMPTTEGPHRPDEVRDIQVFTQQAWKNMQLALNKPGLSVKMLNYHEARIVHDPVLQKEIDDKGLMDAEKDRLKAEADKKQKAKDAEKAEEERIIKEAKAKEKQEAEEKKAAEEEAKAKAKAEAQEVGDAKKEILVNKAAEAKEKEDAKAGAEKTLKERSKPGPKPKAGN